MYTLARLAQFPPVAASPGRLRVPAPRQRALPPRQLSHRTLQDAWRPLDRQCLSLRGKGMGKVYCSDLNRTDYERVSSDSEADADGASSADMPTDAYARQLVISDRPSPALPTLPPAVPSPHPTPAASPSAAERSLAQLRYTIDKVYSSSPLNRFVLFSFTTCLLLLFGTTLISSISMSDVPESAWRAFLYIVDAGSAQLALDESINNRLVAAFLCLLGLVNFGGFVGLTAEAISARIDELDRGFSDVLETDHIVILGYNSKLFPLINELVEANRSEGGVAIVVLSAMSKFQVENQWKGEISEMRKSLHGSQLICRQGDPQLAADLQRVNVLKARSVIILAADNIYKAEERDAFVLRVLLGLESVARGAAQQEQLGGGAPGKELLASSRPMGWQGRGGGQPTRHVVAELESRSHVDVLQYLGTESSHWTVSHVVSRDLLSRLMVQAVFMPGITTVFAHLLSFNGSEFYFYPLPPDCPVRRFGRLQFHFLDSVLCGVWHPEDGLLLCPGEDYEVAADESLVVLAEDNDRITLMDQPRAVWTAQDDAWFERRRAQQMSTGPIWAHLRNMLVSEMQKAGQCRVQVRSPTSNGAGAMTAAGASISAPPATNLMVDRMRLPATDGAQGGVSGTSTDASPMGEGGGPTTKKSAVRGQLGMRRSGRVKTRSAPPLQGKLRHWAVVIEETSPEEQRDALLMNGTSEDAPPTDTSKATGSALPASHRSRCIRDLGDDLRLLLRLLEAMAGTTASMSQSKGAAAASMSPPKETAAASPAGIGAPSPNHAARAGREADAVVSGDGSPAPSYVGGRHPSGMSWSNAAAGNRAAVVDRLLEDGATSTMSTATVAASLAMADKWSPAAAVEERGPGEPELRGRQGAGWSLAAGDEVSESQDWPMLCDELLSLETVATAGDHDNASSHDHASSRESGSALQSSSNGYRPILEGRRVDDHVEGHGAAVSGLTNGSVGTAVASIRDGGPVAEAAEGPQAHWPIRVDETSAWPSVGSPGTGRSAVHGAAVPLGSIPGDMRGHSTVNGVPSADRGGAAPEAQRQAHSEGASMVRKSGGDGGGRDGWGQEVTREGSSLPFARVGASTSAGTPQEALEGSSGVALAGRPPTAKECLWDISPSTDFDGLTQLITACRQMGRCRSCPSPGDSHRAAQIIRDTMTHADRRALLALLDDAGASGASVLEEWRVDGGGGGGAASPAWELPQKVLICGWPNDVETIILSLDRYLAPGSEVTFMSPAGVRAAAARLQERSHLVSARPKKVRVNYVSGDPLRRVDLERVRVEEYAAVLVTWDTLVGAEPSLAGGAAVPDINAADTNTIFVGTLIKHIQRVRGGGRPHVMVNELLGSRTKMVAALADVDHGGSFVFLNELTSMALAMAAEDARSRDVMR
eukprot:jgi/Mesvir1/23446/Mv22299-RA.2